MNIRGIDSIFFSPFWLQVLAICFSWPLQICFLGSLESTEFVYEHKLQYHSEALEESAPGEDEGTNEVDDTDEEAETSEDSEPQKPQS